MRARPWAGHLAVALVATGCKGSQASSAGGADAAEEAGPPAEASAIASRCRPGAPGPNGGSLGDAVVGDAVVSGRGGIAVGMVHAVASADASRATTAAVALLAPVGAAVRVVDLGATPADAPAPRLAWRAADADELVALASTSSTELALYGVGANGAVKPGRRIPVGELGASDVAVGGGAVVVVWEASVAEWHVAPRGVVRALSLEDDGRTVATRDLSSHDVDAEDPRVVAGGTGYFAVWTAGAPLSLPSPAQLVDASAAEGVSEARAARWLEGVVLDAHGAPASPVRRLTSAGRVTSFDVGASAGTAALIVARIEGEPGIGHHAAVERVRLSADGTFDPSITVTSELGTGAPSVVRGAAAWLSWWGPDEEVVMMPAGAAPSGEDVFAESRPLASVGETTVLAAFPASADAGAELRFFACQR